MNQQLAEYEMDVDFGHNESESFGLLNSFLS